MIDTVEFYLHGIQLGGCHEQIWNMCKRYDEGVIVYDKYLPVVLQHKKRRYLRGGIDLESSRQHTRYVPSSHYEINISKTPDDSALKFNFSIPKFFYGTNIVQAIENPNELGFQWFKDKDEFDYHVKHGYLRFRRYLKQFFQSQFPNCRLVEEMLQIVRIDFCFNQIFPSKEQAISHLNLQKSIKRKFSRETSKRGEYATAKTEGSENFSCKIYHKGTEYSEEGDRNKHMWVNKMHARKIFDIDYLQQLSDRTLRYEVTLRNPHLSYLYNNKVFRKNSESFLAMKRLYNQLKAAYEIKEEEDLNKKIDELVKEYERKVINKYPKGMVSMFYDLKVKQLVDYVPNENQMRFAMKWFYDRFQTLSTKSRKFWFELPDNEIEKWRIDKKYNRNLFDTVQDCKFSNFLFKECAGFLWSYMKDMQIIKREAVDFYLLEIDKWNKDVKNGRKDTQGKIYLSWEQKEKDRKRKLLNKNKLSLIITALGVYSWDELPKKLAIEKRTWFRYTADLKKIGITKNTQFTSDVQKIEYTYEEYYNEMVRNQNRVFINDSSLKLSI